MSGTTEATANIKTLEDMLRPHQEQCDVLTRALREVSQEDSEKRVAAAKTLIRRALELQSQMQQTEAQFNAAKKKFDKELGQTLNKLRNMASGKALDEGLDEQSDPKNGEQSES